MKPCLMSILVISLFAVSACAPAGPGAAPTPVPTDTRSPTATNLPTSTPSHTPTATQTPTSTATFSPTITLTPSITPTYAILRGEVLQRSNCRHGPGAVYLYKYGLIAGSVLEVIGRNELGSWILIRAIGGTNPCWLNATLMDIRGDVMSVSPVDPDIILPWSPFYLAPTSVSAKREGNQVTVAWDPLVLRAGDDSEQIPYVVAAWVCVQGELVFTPVGSYTNWLTITDEPGCTEPSHGRLYAAEKHGYTQWVKIPWPQADPSFSPTSTTAP